MVGELLNHHSSPGVCWVKSLISGNWKSGLKGHLPLFQCDPPSRLGHGATGPDHYTITSELLSQLSRNSLGLLIMH